jgi:hypothetical protein
MKKVETPLKKAEPVVDTKQLEIDNEVKRKQEQGKFDDLSVKIDDIKERAAVEYNKGMYEDAIKEYEKASSLAIKNEN